MKTQNLCTLLLSLSLFAFAASARAGSVCSVSEYFNAVSNSVPSCGSYDYNVSFSTSCDGAKPTIKKPVVYSNGCPNVVTQTREQLESGYLATFISLGYHIAGNYRLSDSVTVYTLEK